MITTIFSIDSLLAPSIEITLFVQLRKSVERSASDYCRNKETIVVFDLSSVGERGVKQTISVVQRNWQHCVASLYEHVLWRIRTCIP